MQASARYKEPGQKLVQARIEYDSEIRAVEILGDFFIYPEEAISLIEKSLLGMRVSSSKDELAERVRKAASENGIEMIGVTPEGIATAVYTAMIA